MSLIFDDEFSGASLPSTWENCYWYSLNGCGNGNEMEWYTPNNISVSGGALHLTAEKQTVNGHDYTSGMVTSYDHFSFTYGYVEWQAQIPAGQGFWPALWLLPENGSWPPEIDALEVVGAQPDVATGTYHEPDGTSQGHDVVIPGLSSGGWHTFGVDWEPGSITWYIDGKARYSSTTDVTSLPMYLVMNLAVGGTWPGPPNASTPFPSSFNIDYVRVWQH